MNRFNDPPVEPVYFVDVGGTLVDIQEDFDTYTSRGVGYIFEFLKPNPKIQKQNFIQQGMKIRNNIRKKAHAHLYEYPCREFIKQVLTAFSIPNDQNLLEQCEKAFIQAEMEITLLFPDTLPFLEKSLNSDKRMFVASNNFSTLMVDKILTLYGIQKYFEGVYVSETMGYRKPHTGFLTQIINDLDLNPQDCVMIGDNPEMDGLAAERAGVAFFKVN